MCMDRKNLKVKLYVADAVVLWISGWFRPTPRGWWDTYSLVSIAAKLIGLPITLMCEITGNYCQVRKSIQPSAEEASVSLSAIVYHSL